MLTQLAYRHYGDAVKDVMPALGCHEPLTEEEREKMFEIVPAELFRVHDWRNDVVTIGHVPAPVVKEASRGQLDVPWPAQLNRLVWEGEHDLVLSIGQVVPHEVMGMSNFNKNLFVGLGGKEAIDLSHFIGACYGMEKMMGRADNPLRRILNRASDAFLKKLPLVYVLTVIGPAGNGGGLALRGLFIGDDEECFKAASKLSIEVNFTLVPRPIQKAVVFLDRDEFKSTWLGNKSIYRTRMAMADGGELIVMAPGVTKFGEDPGIDSLIRQFGYRTTPEIMAFLKKTLELRESLSAAAHLIHGSSEGRFTITYCPGGLTREEVEGVGFNYAPLVEMIERYPPSEMREGFNDNGEETVFYVSNPALGLWAVRERLMVEEGEDQRGEGRQASTDGADGVQGFRQPAGDVAEGDGGNVFPA
eukprot:jgi/Undpi1/13135/HiC_scaffold_8.g02797.m1